MNYFRHKFRSNPQSRYPTNTKMQSPKWHNPLNGENILLIQQRTPVLIYLLGNIKIDWIKIRISQSVIQKMETIFGQKAFCYPTVYNRGMNTNFNAILQSPFVWIKQTQEYPPILFNNKLRFILHNHDDMVEK